MRDPTSMIRSSIATLAVAGLICVVHPSWAAEPASSGAPNVNAEIARSRALYREAQSAFESGQYPIAQQKLLQAWEIRKTFDVASALTQVDLELKQYGEAAKHAEYCLRVFAPAESDATLKSVQEMYAEARKHVATLRIRATPNGTQIEVAGKLVGTAPLDSPLFLEPGRYEIRAHFGTANASHIIDLGANQEQDVSLDVPPETQPRSGATGNHPSPAVPIPSDASRAQPQPRDFEPVYWTLAIGGTVTAVGLVTGLLYRARANSKEDSASAIQARTPTCINVTSADCGALATLVSERNNANTTAQVLLGATGAAAVATGVITYLLWPTNTSNGSIKTSAWATPNSAGLGLGGQF